MSTATVYLRDIFQSTLSVEHIYNSISENWPAEKSAIKLVEGDICGYAYKSLTKGGRKLLRDLQCSVANGSIASINAVLYCPSDKVVYSKEQRIGFATDYTLCDKLTDDYLEGLVSFMALVIEADMSQDRWQSVIQPIPKIFSTMSVERLYVEPPPQGPPHDGLQGIRTPAVVVVSPDGTTLMREFLTNWEEEFSREHKRIRRAIERAVESIIE